MLTPKQEKFAQEYVITGNASEAYRRAYPNSLKWKENAVHTQASALLKSSKVSVRVEELQKRTVEKFDISAERLLLEQARLATSDLRKLFDENGNLLDVTALPDDIAAAVSSVKVSTVKDGDGNVIDTITEIKLWNKNTSLDSLFKNKGLYEKDNSQKKQEIPPDERKARIKYLLAKAEAAKC